MRYLWFLFLLVPVYSDSTLINIFKSNLPINTVDNIDLSSYTGKWYQAATSKSTKIFGTGIKFSNVTATYECIGECKDNNITVLNEGYNENNDYVKIKGYSYCEDNEIGSKRKLHFEGVPFEGNYWVVKLGPLINNKYEYSVISGPLNKLFGTRFSLYVICRDIEDYKLNYEDEVKEWCSNNGYIFPWNKYVKTY